MLISPKVYICQSCRDIAQEHYITSRNGPEKA